MKFVEVALGAMLSLAPVLGAWLLLAVSDVITSNVFAAVFIIGFYFAILWIMIVVLEIYKMVEERL